MKKFLAIITVFLFTITGTFENFSVQAQNGISPSYYGQNQQQQPKQRSTARSRRGSGRGSGKYFHLIPGLAIARSDYSETGTKYDHMAFDGNLDIYFQPPTGRWAMGLQGSSTLAFFSQSESINTRFFSVSPYFRMIVYRESRFHFDLTAGYNYKGMLVQNNAFGYKNIQSPLLFPTWGFGLNGGGEVLLSVRFQPIMGLTLKDRIVLVQLDYWSKKRGSNGFGFRAEYQSAKFNAKSAFQGNNIPVQSNHLMFGMNYAM